MKKRVLLFAAAKESVGRDSVDIELAENATVRDLRIQLANDYPDLKELVQRSFVAVDQEFAADQLNVADAIEIGLIPPVSGG